MAITVTDGYDATKDVVLTEEEVKFILDGLRMSEKHSRNSFAGWVSRNLTRVSTEDLTTKVMRARETFEKLASLRAKFGDTDPVKLD